MTRTIKVWIGTALLIFLFTLASVAWFDRPVALRVHELFGTFHAGRELAASPGVSIPLIAAAIFFVFGLAQLLGRQFSRLEVAVLICDISLLATDVTKDQLKSIFGRTWPDSWAPGILSLIHDNEYGFHFFHSGRSFTSFPSGHAAALAAVTSVLWIMLPRLRTAATTCTAAADLALVALNLHFLSDVVVGTFLGASIGLFTVSLWSAVAPSASHVRS